jgi:hypothetical protein
MRNRTTLPFLLLCSVLLVLTGCAAKPLVTDQQIAAAEASGTLPELYNTAKSQLVGKDRRKKGHAPLFAQLDAIGRRLGSRMDYDLRKRIDGARMANNIVPLNVLTDAQAEAESMRTWEPARHDAFARDVGKELVTTQKAVKDVENYIKALPAGAIRKHMDALRQMEQLTGDSRYAAHRESMLKTLRGDFEHARATDDFEKALVLLEELPPADDIGQQRIELQTRLFERKFNESLAEDNPDAAYALFETMARSPYFNDVKERIGPTCREMSNYFIALATNATQAGNMTDAYRWFGQSRSVRMKLDGRVEPALEEQAFIERAVRGHDKARAESRWGVALGYLLIVQEFDPHNAVLASNLRLAEEEANRGSIRSATVQPFSNAAGNADYSTAMATRITEFLFQTIPEDIRIISYDNQSVPVDYLINGSIDEARVESTASTTRKTERVVTETGVTTRNPKYDDWLKLPERERKFVAPPPAQLVSDRKEDISYNVTQMRKVGYFSAAFRLLEASTGKVLHTDSLTIKRELADEGNEGVELGEFRLTAKSANLPTDVEILNQISTESAQEIGKRITARIGEVEKRYADAGKQAVAGANMIEAATQFSYAVATAQRKKIDAAGYRTDLKRAAAASGFAN